MSAPVVPPDSEAAALTAFLADRDVPCPSCDYNLRGLPSGVCPECNQNLVLRVGLAEPRLAPYLFTLIFTSAGGGFGLIVLTLFTIDQLRRGRVGTSNDRITFAIITSATLVNIILMTTLLRKRRILLRSPRRTQWMRAALVAGFQIGFLTAFFAAVP